MCLHDHLPTIRKRPDPNPFHGFMLGGVPPILATVRPVKKSSLTSFGRSSKSLRDEPQKEKPSLICPVVYISFDIMCQLVSFRSCPLPPISLPAPFLHRPPISPQSSASSAVSTSSPHSQSLR